MRGPKTPKRRKAMFPVDRNLGVAVAQELPCEKDSRAIPARSERSWGHTHWLGIYDFKIKYRPFRWCVYGMMCLAQHADGGLL